MKSKSVESVESVESVKSKRGKKISMDGINYNTLTDAVILLPNCARIEGKHHPYSISIWNKLSRELKKNKETTFDGHIFILL